LLLLLPLDAASDHSVSDKFELVHPKERKKNNPKLKIKKSSTSGGLLLTKQLPPENTRFGKPRKGFSAESPQSHLRIKNDGD